MKNLAASCMLVEAIGEGIKKIDRITQSELLVERPEIPWEDVMEIRNHIAHGYFDIDGDIFRDGKQFAGLTDCQDRDRNKRNFAYNMSFAVINTIKAILYEKNENLSVGEYLT